MKENTNKGKGFTIIETLVAIFIIAVLAAIVASSVKTQQIKAQNDKRLADVRSYAQALQLYYFDHGSFIVESPDGSGCCFGSSPGNDICKDFWGGIDCPPGLTNSLLPYLTSLPIDNTPIPITGGSVNGYYYISPGLPSNGAYTKVSIGWFLAKTNQNCGIGFKYFNYSASTVCRYDLQ